MSFPLFSVMGFNIIPNDVGNLCFGYILTDEFHPCTMSRVCKKWACFLQNANKLLPLAVSVYANNKYFPSDLYKKILELNRCVISKTTADMFRGLKLCRNPEYTRQCELDTFISYYNPKTWKHMSFPTEQHYAYDRHYSFCLWLKNLFNTLSWSGNNYSFSYFRKLFVDDNFSFREDSFVHMAENTKLGVRFIRWILKTRPNAIIITKAGICKLIERGFPAKDIRDIVLNPTKYEVVSERIEEYGCDDYGYPYERKYYEKSTRREMIDMACEQYWRNSKMEYDDDVYPQSDRDEYIFYHRLASDDKVSRHLCWALNGCTSRIEYPEYHKRALEFVYFIDEVIEINSDVKPYEIYRCYTFYDSPRPYQFIEK